jgi:hypothetical protein
MNTWFSVQHDRNEHTLSSKNSLLGIGEDIQWGEKRQPEPFYVAKYSRWLAMGLPENTPRGGTVIIEIS